jgi:hypothetical protein
MSAKTPSRFLLVCVGVGLAGLVAPVTGAVGAGAGRLSADAARSAKPPAAAPDLGPNVIVFDPSMPTSQIQATVDAIGTQQVGNQFGPQRYALLFEPGTYGSAATPLNFQVGYYTAVAGLGRSPGDVVINGSAYVRNQCVPGFCVALNNFWRSLSNLTINVTTPGFGCYSGEFWAVSQAAPMRRVHVNGQTTLMDYCTGPSYASGGFIADSRFDGNVINGSQQQWITRDSVLAGWSNGVWNQVFSGVAGAPAQCFPAAPSCGGPYTTLPTSPVTREAPYLYTDSGTHRSVFVPGVRRNSSGTSWDTGPTAGTSIPIEQFFVARPGDGVQSINNALSQGKNLLFTPGVYNIDATIKVKRADTVVLGLGFATLVPQGGVVPMTVADVPGVKIAGLIFDAGPTRSPVLLQVGTKNSHKSDADDPTTLSDVFFRIGGAAAGSATVSLEVNSDQVILDDIWAWRADHGSGVGWTVNTADTGVIVNGDDVTAYGLFVEHYQKLETIWNGERGTVVFFQNEMPYDPPSQAAWTAAPGSPGYAALKVADDVRSFRGTGMGSYSFFNQGIDIFAAHAFEVPTSLPPGSLTDLLTIFLDPSAGKGGILNVVNDTGGSSTIANPDVPVTVVTYP